MIHMTHQGQAIPTVPISDCAVTSPDFLDAYNDITRASQDLLPEAGFG